MEDGMLYLLVALIFIAVLLLLILAYLLISGKKQTGFQSRPDNHTDGMLRAPTFDRKRGIDADRGVRDIDEFLAYREYYGGTVTQISMRLKASIVFEDCSSKAVYRGRLGDEIVMGRLVRELWDLNDIPVSPSVTVSRRHCRLFESNGYIFIENLSQSGKTLLNDNAVVGVEPVKVGDIIGISDVNLRIVDIQLF